MSREAGTWGLRKNSKMAAVRHQDGSIVFRVFPRFVAIVCLNFKARLSFFSMYHLFFLEAYLFFPWGFYIVYASSYFIFHKNTKLGS